LSRSRSGSGIAVACRVFSVRDDVPHHVLHAGWSIDFGDVEGGA
jgi:hypothetical protein